MIALPHYSSGATKPARKIQKRVLIVLGWYDYRLHRGIEKYALEHGWHLTANFTRERVIPWGWEGDGILAWLGADDELAEFVRHAGKPTVDFSFRRPHLPFARVVENHTRAAELVAEHFLSRGLTHFMFYSDADNWSYEERGKGFVEALRQANHDCTWVRWHQSAAGRSGQGTLKQKRRWLLAQLKSAPKPVAVFAANDEQALDVLETCEDNGLAVPEEVAIVGAENNLLAPETKPTPISSVDTNLETLGYRGAARLAEVMRRPQLPAAPLRIPPLGVVIRKSSDLLAVEHKGVATGLRFMWEHFHEDITVTDLMRVTTMSRRGLQKAFLANIGRPPRQELQRLRIEKAKKLLAVSDYKIEMIGGTCGYQSPNSFSVAFRNATGISPKQYRNTFIQ